MASSECSEPKSWKMIDSDKGHHVIQFESNLTVGPQAIGTWEKKFFTQKHIHSRH